MREEERTRLARELHDDLGQFEVVVRSELARMGLVEGLSTPLGQGLAAISTATNQFSHASRRLIQDLPPQVLEDLGPAPAFEWLAMQFSSRTGTPVELVVEPEELSAPMRQASALFRVTQEALVNVERHAQARRVELALLAEGERLMVTIRDDGTGLAILPGRYGLRGMKERVESLDGTFTLESQPGKGTEITASVPLKRA